VWWVCHMSHWYEWARKSWPMKSEPTDQIPPRYSHPPQLLPSHHYIGRRFYPSQLWKDPADWNSKTPRKSHWKSIIPQLLPTAPFGPIPPLIVAGIVRSQGKDIKSVRTPSYRTSRLGLHPMTPSAPLRPVLPLVVTDVIGAPGEEVQAFQTPADRRDRASQVTSEGFPSTTCSRKRYRCQYRRYRSGLRTTKRLIVAVLL
jgi:hypothetical protein